MIEQQEQEISAEDYHKLPGVSSTRLKDYIQDPRVYHYKYVSGRYVQQRKDEFDFGLAVHEVSLLGDKSNIVVIPKEALSASGSKAGGAWKQFCEANSGKTLLKQHEYDSVMRCVDAIRKHPVAGKLLSTQGVAEKMFTARLPELPFDLRCKPDKLIFPGSKNIVLDIKTTDETRAPVFVRSVANYGYANQEYFYRKVLAENDIEIDSFIFIAVSKSEPHTVDCYTLSHHWLQMAQDEVEGALSDLARRMLDDDWSVETDSKAAILHPPNYIRNKGEYVL